MIWRWPACIIGWIVASKFLLQPALIFWGVSQGPPIDLTVAIPLLALLVPVFFVCRFHAQRLKAVIICSIVSIVGVFCFFLSDNEAFNQLFYSIAWSGAGICCWLFRQKLMAIMCGVMVGFGALMVLRIGAEIPRGEFTLWVIVRNALWVALICVPAAQIWNEDAPAELSTIEDCGEQQRGDHQQAA